MDMGTGTMLSGAWEVRAGLISALRAVELILWGLVGGSRKAGGGRNADWLNGTAKQRTVGAGGAFKSRESGVRLGDSVSGWVIFFRG